MRGPQGTAGTDGGSVLLVEDDAIIARLVARHLELLGCCVTHAPTGADALAACGTSRFDLILLDHGLPDLDGTEATRRLRAQPGGDEVPIVWLTGDLTLADDPRAESADAVHTKPLTSSQLREIARRWVRPTAGRSAGC